MIPAGILAYLILSTFQVVSGQSLCDHITHIKVLPLKGERGVDADYDLLIEAGKAAIPCLVRRVTDPTKVRDPRQESGYSGIQVRVGDVAYFVLTDIAKTAFVDLLPSSVQKDWKDVGVLAYFKFVQRKENRRWFRQKLEAWHGNNARCLINRSQAPTVYGFRLGMSLHRAIGRFPEFKKLTSLEQASKIELNLEGRSGERAIHAWRVYRGGVVIEFHSSYLRQHFIDEAEVPGLIRLTFWGERLKAIQLDLQAARWTTIDAFTADISKTYGFSNSWWQEAEVVKRTIDSGIELNPDFVETVSQVDCDAFRVSASCVGPPAPPGNCRLAIQDLNPPLKKNRN